MFVFVVLSQLVRPCARAAQITCDYDLFEWDCAGKEIEACGCGAAQCRGRIRGFAFLDEATQRRTLQFACDPVLDEWHRQNPTVRLRGYLDTHTLTQHRMA